MSEAENTKPEATLTNDHPAETGSGSARTAAPEAPSVERRQRPRPKISTEPPAPPPPPRLDDYAPIIGKPELDDLRFLARQLRGKTVKMVNSTAVGGGVAEMLNRLIPLLNELEVVTKWEVITGGNDFFEVTKGFHNALHGGEYAVTQAVKDIFMMYNEQNRQRMEFVEDLFVIHDPQPAGLIRSKERNRGRWVWRCHIDLSNPDPDVWGFLRPFIDQYDAAVFSSPAFAASLPIPVSLLSLHRSAFGKKQGSGRSVRSGRCATNFGVDRIPPDRHADFALRSAEGPRGRAPGLQAGQEICGLPIGAGGRRRER